MMNLAGKFVTDLTGRSISMGDMVKTDGADDPLRILFLVDIVAEQCPLDCHIIFKCQRLFLNSGGVEIIHPIRLELLKKFLVPHIEVKDLIRLIRFYHFE
jgi:hypothetical protein